VRAVPSPTLARGYTLTSRWPPPALWMCDKRDGYCRGDAALFRHPHLYTTHPFSARVHTQHPLPWLSPFRDRLFSAPLSPVSLQPPKNRDHITCQCTKGGREGGGIAPSRYESFQHTEPSTGLKIEIADTPRSMGSRHSAQISEISVHVRYFGAVFRFGIFGSTTSHNVSLCLRLWGTP
jgi:hypothetical protein